MNWVDIVIAIFLLFSIIGGLRSGLISMLLGIIGLVFGIWLAGRLYVPFGDVLGFIPSETAARIIAFIIILAAVIVAASFAGKILTKVASVIMLGWINRLGGAAFGLVMGAFWIGLILAIWIHFFNTPAAVQNSALASFLLKGVPIVLGLLPSEFDAIKNFFQ